MGLHTQHNHIRFQSFDSRSTFQSYFIGSITVLVWKQFLIIVILCIYTDSNSPGKSVAFGRKKSSDYSIKQETKIYFKTVLAFFKHHKKFKYGKSMTQKNNKCVT